MSDHANNEILANLGGEPEVDPLQIIGMPDELRQATVRDRVVDATIRLSVNYETLPLYIESFLLAVIRDMFEQDETFPYDEDELKTKIYLGVNWSRGAIESRDGRPRVVVSFQSANADNVVLRDTFQATMVPEILGTESQGLMENMQFRIVVIHHNRSLALFLAQSIRAQIASVMDLLRQVFGLQKVFPPSIYGPGQLEEYDDLFGSIIDLRVQVVPKWDKKVRPEYIKRIIIATTGTAAGIMEGAIVQTQAMYDTQGLNLG